MKFKMTKSTDSRGVINYIFEGSLTEESELLPIEKVASDGVVNLDMKSLKSINSVGIRSFMNWVHQISSEQLFLTNCPPIFVQQLSVVTNFLPERSRIRSFYTPYFCETSDQEKMVLYERGVNYRRKEDQSVEIIHPVVQSAAGEAFEVDVNTDRYFSFLKKFG